VRSEKEGDVVSTLVISNISCLLGRTALFDLGEKEGDEREESQESILVAAKSKE
jgi:hypothetical protein